MHRREGRCKGISQEKWGVGSDGGAGFAVRIFPTGDAGEGD